MKKIFGLGKDDYVRVELTRSILQSQDAIFWKRFSDFLNYLDDDSSSYIRKLLNKISRPDIKFMMASDLALVLLIGFCLGSVKCWFGIHGLKGLHCLNAEQYLNVVYLDKRSGKTMPLNPIPYCFFYDNNTPISHSVECFKALLKDDIFPVSISIDSLEALHK